MKQVYENHYKKLLEATNTKKEEVHKQATFYILTSTESLQKKLDKIYCIESNVFNLDYIKEIQGSLSSSTEKLLAVALNILGIELEGVNISPFYLKSCFDENCWSIYNNAIKIYSNKVSYNTYIDALNNRTRTIVDTLEEAKQEFDNMLNFYDERGQYEMLQLDEEDFDTSRDLCLSYIGYYVREYHDRDLVEEVERLKKLEEDENYIII